MAMLPLALSIAFLSLSNAIAYDKPIVAVSISGILPLVRPIAGERADVVVLLPSGVEAHRYTLKPDVVEKALKADLIVHTGHIPWEVELAEIVAREKGVEVSEISLDLLHDLGLKLLRTPSVNEPNVHAFWLLPENCKKIAYEVAIRLSKIDPLNRELYLERAEEFMNNVDLFFEEALKEVKEKGLVGKRVVAGFYAEQYVAESLGLKTGLILMREGGLSPKTLEVARSGLLNGTFIAILRSEIAESFPQLSSQIEALSYETGAPIYDVRVFSVGGVYDYISLMSYNLGSITSLRTENVNVVEEGFLFYLAVLLAIFAGAELIIIAFLHKRLSER